MNRCGRLKKFIVSIKSAAFGKFKYEQPYWMQVFVNALITIAACLTTNTDIVTRARRNNRRAHRADGVIAERARSAFRTSADQGGKSVREGLAYCPAPMIGLTRSPATPAGARTAPAGSGPAARQAHRARPRPAVITCHYRRHRSLCESRAMPAPALVLNTFITSAAGSAAAVRVNMTFHDPHRRSSLRAPPVSGSTVI